MTNKNLIIIIIAVAVIVFAVVWGYFGAGVRQPAGTAPEAGQPPSAAPTQAPPSAPSPTTTPPPTPATKPATKSSISIISPAASDKWVLGQSHTIQWSKEAGVTGSIYLVNAADGTTVGWINSEINVHQTYYSWNSGEVSLARYSPAKKNIPPGQYVIKIKFDNKVQPEIKSAAFSIIAASTEQIPVYNITIKNFAFSPNTLTVKKGDKVVFTNNDSVTHRVLLGNIPPYTLAPGASTTVDTSILFASTYAYYCDIYPSMTGTLIVQ
jgi:plastocyanin